jgi:hypothetical protein
MLLEKRQIIDTKRQNTLLEAHTAAEALRLHGQAEADVLWAKQVASCGTHAAIAIITRAEVTESISILRECFSHFWSTTHQ